MVSVTLDSFAREAGDLLRLTLVFFGLRSAFAPLSTVWTEATGASPPAWAVPTATAVAAAAVWWRDPPWVVVRALVTGFVTTVLFVVVVSFGGLSDPSASPSLSTAAVLAAAWVAVLVVVAAVASPRAWRTLGDRVRHDRSDDA